VRTGDRCAALVSARTGRSDHVAQVKPLWPHPDEAIGRPEPRPAVNTLTAVKARETSVEPHASHAAFAPSEYAAMDILTSKRSPQLRQT
jgi:hypothetical protein